MTAKDELKDLHAVIQICDCGKIDAYKDDGHDCVDEIAKQINRGDLQ
jgi:hypothetical protein